MLLNCFQWGVLALYIMDESDYTKQDIFNYDAASIRIDTYKTIVKRYFKNGIFT